jgi:hypothetical protein
MGIIVIICISLAGCVAPPAEQKVTPTDMYDPNQFATAATTAPNGSGLVTEVTPFVAITTVDTRITYNTLAPIAQPVIDKSCRIHTKTQTYAFNGSAFTYNLKNPPMFINYSVIPTNYTEKRVVAGRSGTRADETIEIDTYSPYSWFEITIRNKTTGEIYQQDGFQNGHSTYLKNTFRVNKQGDLLIEMKGNLITATADFWVKPAINFDDPEQANSTVCTEMSQTRVSLPYTTMTPTPTWTG